MRHPARGVPPRRDALGRGGPPPLQLERAVQSGERRREFPGNIDIALETGLRFTTTPAANSSITAENM